MARPAKFTAERILDAAAEVVREYGRSAAVSQVAERLGAPSGSIYYRFGSREELFVELWLRSVGRFQAGFRQALDQPDAHRALLAAAVHIPRFCRSQPADAIALTLFRQPDLVHTAPASLAERVAHVNDQVFEQLRQVAQRRFPDGDGRGLQLVDLACRESPYGLVRRQLLAGEAIPVWLDDVVAVSSDAILRLGDAPEGDVVAEVPDQRGA